MDKTEKVFAEGIWFDRPREGAPDFVKGRINIKVPDLIIFLENHRNNAGYVNLDLKISKAGKLYLELNTWTPGQQANTTNDNADPNAIPF